MTNAITTRPTGIVAALALKYEMDPTAFAQTVKATVFPNGQATNEQLAAFCAVAREYGLSPFTKQVFAFPNKGGGITPMVSVDGWVSMMNSHPAMDGIDFEPLRDDDGKVYAMRCIIKRKDRSSPISVVEFLDECKGSSQPWLKSPMRMLRHRAMIQCARIAFGFSGIYDEEEAARIVEAEVSNATPEPKSLRALTERFTPPPHKADIEPFADVPDAPRELTPAENAELDRKLAREQELAETKEQADALFGGEPAKPRKARSTEH